MDLIFKIALAIMLVPIALWVVAWMFIWAIGLLGWSLETFDNVIDWPERFIRRKLGMPQNPLSYDPQRSSVNWNSDDDSR